MSADDKKYLSIEMVEPTVEPVGDKVHRLTMAAAQLVPYVGGALAEAFHGIVKSPMERRQLQAMEVMMDAINELRNKSERPVETLMKDDAFISTFFTASQLAVRTAEPEKLAAIKQAVIKGALDSSISEAIQQMYLSTLSQMTSIHLRLLTYFKGLNAATVQKNNTGDRVTQDSYFERAAKCFPEGINKAILERATRELNTLGVIAVPQGFPQSLGGPNFVTMMLTDFGRGFVDFISQ
jgi:hypothetical protein